jgi:hypothetical protein
MVGKMTLQEFKELAESYGSDLARWPERKRKEAHEMLASGPEAVQVLRDEQVLDRLLNVRDIPPLSAAFEAKILSIPEQVKQDAAEELSLLLIWMRPVWAKALVLVLCAFIGYGVGTMKMDGVHLQVATQQAVDSQTVTPGTKRSISLDSVILGPTALYEVII